MLRDTAPRYKPVNGVGRREKNQRRRPGLSPADGAAYQINYFVFRNGPKGRSLHGPIGLGVAVQGFGFALVHVKNGQKLGDRQQVLQFLRQIQEL